MLFMVPQSAWATYRAVATKGKLPGAFSVSSTKQVWFSQGNLQYQADNGDGGSTWRFAINQYDFVGDATHGNVYLGETKCDNANISSTYTGWIDLFGWATSGNSASGTAYQPWSISTTNSYYGPAISSGEWTAANSDWGVVNVAQLGSGWRTLTYDEWVYLINTRTNASSFRTFATVNGVVGLILMPDGWTTSGVSLTITTANYTSNDISLAQWNKLETTPHVIWCRIMVAIGLPLLTIYNMHITWMLRLAALIQVTRITAESASVFVSFQKPCSQVPEQRKILTSFIQRRLGITWRRQSMQETPILVSSSARQKISA